jgi:hypothetical protein
LIECPATGHEGRAFKYQLEISLTVEVAASRCDPVMIAPALINDRAAVAAAVVVVAA